MAELKWKSLKRLFGATGDVRIVLVESQIDLLKSALGLVTQLSSRVLTPAQK